MHTFYSLCFPITLTLLESFVRHGLYTVKGSSSLKNKSVIYSKQDLANFQGCRCNIIGSKIDSKAMQTKTS